LNASRYYEFVKVWITPKMVEISGFFIRFPVLTY
jgi:hypothetical protein